ncbi:MAG TPA: FHA domain-containing protein [Kofleriaceae bacterium]|nr:FHA domain-containing protein [Kofleriaceae bacterium]
MAKLENRATGLGVELPSHCLCGRTPLALVRLEHAAASREHAVLEWARHAWRIRDLSTRNGTFVNGRSCSEAWQELCAGDELAFGADDEAWVLVDDTAPPPAAIASDGTIRMGRGDLLLLPDDEAPEVSVQRKGNTWILDRGDGVSAAESGTQIALGEATWELLLPSGTPLTSTAAGARAPHLGSLRAVFEFDRTEEHVRLTLRGDEEDIALPSRAFHHMLLVLARARVHDRKVRGLSEAESGWIDSLELARMLGARPDKVNLDVFRARKLLAEHGVAGAANVIERRSDSRQLRVGFRELDLVPL